MLARNDGISSIARLKTLQAIAWTHVVIYHHDIKIDSMRQDLSLNYLLSL